MKKVLATLGHADGTGSIVELDLDRGIQLTLISYTPAPELHVVDKGFTGAVWLGAPGQSDLVACSFNALHRFRGPKLDRHEILHRPDMNDLHGVCRDGNRLLVANTGLDAVDVYDVGGSFLGGYRFEPTWMTTARWLGRTPTRDDHARLLATGWSARAEAFDDDPPAGAYYQPTAGNPLHRRKLRDFVHPNHVAVVGDQILVTRLTDRRVVDVSRQQVVLEAPAPPHDGVLDGDRFWLTCVDGRIVAYEVRDGRATSKVAATLDVSALSRCHGWCRGLAVTDTHIFVGFTAIRRTPQLPWRDHPLYATETAIVALDKSRLEFVATMRIGRDDSSPSKIFTLLPMS